MRVIDFINLKTRKATHALLVVPDKDGKYVGRKVALDNPVACFQQAVALGAVDALDMELVELLRRRHGRAA